MYTNAYRTAISRVLAHIDSHRDSELDLNRLAQIARISKFHFHRVFKEHMGIPLGQYIKLKRIETGMWKLIHTDFNTLEIAMVSGYESHAAFTRAFKKEMGCSPQEFKEQFKESQKLALSRLHENPPVFLGFKNLMPIQIIFVRRRGSYYSAALSAWNQILADLSSAQIRAEGQTFYGMSQDDPNADGVLKENIRFDVGVLISDEIEQKISQLSAERGRLEGGKFAVFLHKGVLDRIPDSYHFIYGKWIFDNEVTLRDERPFFKYRNPLAQMSEQKEAEIYLPVD